MATIDFRARERDGRREDGPGRLFPLTAPLAARSGAVRVFSAEPDLLAGLDERSADFLRHRAVASRVWVDEGAWDPPTRDERMDRSLGLLVIDGLIMRTVELHGQRCPELVGAGDLLRPWEEADGSLAHTTSWTALSRTSLAILDEQFSALVSRWPSIMVGLVSRSIERSRSLAFQLAIVHARHSGLRLHMLFWHLADRWGRVTPEGIHLPLRLTHEVLAQLACMRRPTASSALTGLARRGEIARRADGTWLLTGSPPGGSRPCAAAQ